MIQNWKIIKTVEYNMYYFGYAFGELLSKFSDNVKHSKFLVEINILLEKFLISSTVQKYYKTTEL